MTQHNNAKFELAVHYYSMSMARSDKIGAIGHVIRIKRSHWFVAALHISAAAPALCRAALRIASPIINRPIHLTFIYRLEYRSRLAQIFKRVMIAPRWAYTEWFSVGHLPTVCPCFEWSINNFANVTSLDRRLRSVT